MSLKNLKALLPGTMVFVLLAAVYFIIAWLRHQDNPADRLFPLPAHLRDGLIWLFRYDPAVGGVVFVQDTLASVARLASALIVAAGGAFILAIGFHTWPLAQQFLAPLTLLVAKIPAVALLPILLLWLGTDEEAKIVFLILGLLPSITLQLLHQLNREIAGLRDKLNSITLPAWQEVCFVKLALAWPLLLRLVQAHLGPAWLFLLVSETFGTQVGLGYRIFVMRRFLAMDVILIYVTWIGLLSALLYGLFTYWIGKHRWAHD